MDQKNVFINDSAMAAVWALSDISLKSYREMLEKKKKKKERKKKGKSTGKSGNETFFFLFFFVKR